jgi:hypothetical protein
MKSKLSSRPSARLFRLAAEGIFLSARGGSILDTFPICSRSPYCCDWLNELDIHFRVPAVLLFSRVYREDAASKDLGWWPHLPDGSEDSESRILALLLVAEMIEKGDLP